MPTPAESVEIETANTNPVRPRKARPLAQRTASYYSVPATDTSSHHDSRATASHSDLSSRRSKSGLRSR